MLNIGPMELLLILLVALIFVGPKRLPELGRTIGKSLRELRKAQDEVRSTLNFMDEPPKAAPRRSTPARPKAAGRAETSREDAEPDETSGNGASDAAATRASEIELPAEPADALRPAEPAGTEDATSAEQGVPPDVTEDEGSSTGASRADASQADPPGSAEGE